MNLAENNKGSLDMVPPKFGDRNFSTILAVARNGQPKTLQYGQYLSNCREFRAGHEFSYKYDLV